MPDPTTQSNYLQIATEHLTLDWNLDFNGQIISGSALHHLLVKVDDVKEVIFDTYFLDIIKVEVADKSVPVDLKAVDKVMGRALHAALPSGLICGQYVDVKVTYKTVKISDPTGTDVTALQWLEKEQTLGKQFPYMLSQCQPIYARTLAPLQDTPSVKIKYSAIVTAIYPVLMSAIRVSPPSEGEPHDGKVIGKDLVTYSYNQPVPIPSYLIAIASGNVVYRPFPKFGTKTWTTGVWTEPEMLDDAYEEFYQDIPKFLAQAEDDIGTPYKYGVYDLLVLPPSFPYGGMENACLSFLTPALITGDRSLVDVVVHELTHSWFGNGVTHADARHFWLNEGWTTYMERLLQQVLHTPAHRGLSYIIGQKDLKDSLDQFKDNSRYQRKIIDFAIGENPDNAHSNIPYEKGSNFLLHLERTLGGLEVFLPYAKNYVATFMGQSITTEQWKEHLYSYFERHGGAEKIKALDGVYWNSWSIGEGPLPVKMEYDMTLVQQAYDLAKRWDDSRSTPVSQLTFKDTDLDGFDSNQKSVFLDQLMSYRQLPYEHLRHLGGLYMVSISTNVEIRFRYYGLALLDPTSDISKESVQEALDWVVGDDGTGIIKGRMKYCRPVFKSANAVNTTLTLGIFDTTKMLFHPIARNLIAKDLGLA